MSPSDPTERTVSAVGGISERGRESETILLLLDRIVDYDDGRHTMAES